MEVLFIVIVLGITVFGFFVMKRLDVFLKRNRRKTKDDRKEDPKNVFFGEESDRPEKPPFSEYD